METLEDQYNYFLKRQSLNQYFTDKTTFEFRSQDITYQLYYNLPKDIRYQLNYNPSKLLEAPESELSITIFKHKQYAYEYPDNRKYLLKNVPNDEINNWEGLKNKFLELLVLSQKDINESLDRISNSILEFKSKN